MAVRVASATATAAAAGPPVCSMVGASVVAATAVGVVAAAAGRSAVGDDLAVAVVTLWRSAGVGARTVRLGWELGWDRCWRCDLWIRCRGAWWEEVG
jgi:hypothetical protein